MNQALTTNTIELGLVLYFCKLNYLVENTSEGMFERFIISRKERRTRAMELESL